jgi:hypothetical protein
MRIMQMFFISPSLSLSFVAVIVTVDYSDSGNVSGGESEAEGEEGRRETEAKQEDDEHESPTQSPRHNEISNEIEESAPETTTLQPARNQTLPCDSDRGGCDHDCQMLKFDYDPEPIIQCSCYKGFTLDELDGRRCHGEPQHLIPRLTESAYEPLYRHQRMPLGSWLRADLQQSAGIVRVRLPPRPPDRLHQQPEVYR